MAKPRMSWEHRYLTDTGWVRGENLYWGNRIVAQWTNPGAGRHRAVGTEQALYAQQQIELRQQIAQEKEKSNG